MRGPLDLRWDGGVYYVLGTSLAEGRGYRLLNQPGEIEATQYPPLLPMYIAAHQVIAGTHDPTLVGTDVMGVLDQGFLAPLSQRGNGGRLKRSGRRRRDRGVPGAPARGT